MRLPKTKSKKAKIIVLITAVIVVAGLAYLWFRNTSSNNNAGPAPDTAPAREVNDVDYSPPTDEDKKQQDQQKEEIIQQSTGGSTNPSNITVSISRANQAGAGQPLDIRTIVTGASSGTCEVTLSQAGQASITRLFAIGIEATYSVCANAQVAATDFPAGGTWTLRVIAKSGSSSSEPVSQSVTIAK